MQRLVLWMIDFYQSTISPHKGFSCAHHVLHGNETCSNAVKYLIKEQGLLRSVPAVRARFNECQAASESLSFARHSSSQADLPVPCDAPCDVSFGDCSGSSPPESTNSCTTPCLVVPEMSFSKKKKGRILLVFCLFLLLLSYWFYGREVNSIYIERIATNEGSGWTKFLVRDNPKVRVMLLADGKKYYSNVVSLHKTGVSYKLLMKHGPTIFDIERIEIQDARLNVGDNLLVVGQILETINDPNSAGEGVKFRFNINRRWHLY